MIGGFLDSNKQTTSANTAISNGIYYVGSNGYGAPIENDIGTLVVFRRSTRIVQYYHSVAIKSIYVRFSSDSGSIWSDWIKLI